MKRLFTIVFVLLTGLSLSAQDVTRLLLEAKSLVDTSRPDKALSLLVSSEETSKDARSLLMRADIYLMNNNLSAAIADYNSANRLSPGSGEYGLARCYAMKSDAATAVYHLEREMQSDFKRAEKELMLDDYLSGISLSNEWKQFLKNDWYSKVESQLSEVEYYIATGKTGEALSLLTSLKRDYADDSDVRYMSALFDYSVGSYDKAINVLLPMVNENDERNECRDLLAKSYYAAGNFAGAIPIYNEMVASGVADARLYFYLADSYCKVGEFVKAKANIDTYLSLYPEEETALQLAGKIGLLKGDYKDALLIYSKMIDNDGGNPRYFTDRGDTYFLSKSWELAVSDYGMALDIEPGNSQNWLNKGLSHIYLNQKETGCYCFRMAVKTGNTDASQLIEKYCK